jgi:hypothetical protein
MCKWRALVLMLTVGKRLMTKTFDLANFFEKKKNKATC